MDKFLFTSATGTTGDAICASLIAKLGPLPINANIGFIYGTDGSGPLISDVLSRLKTATGIAHWTGTIGLGMTVMGQEYYDSPAVAVMLARIPETDFRMIEPQAIDVSNFVAQHVDWLAHDEYYFGVLHADPTNNRTPALIDALAEAVPNPFFVGGMTSATGHHLQISDEVTSGGVSGVLFSSQVPIVTGHTQGCSPIGASHLVTSSQRNIVIELDGRPALDVLREDVGEVIAKDLRRMAGYIFAALPISGSDTGDYLVRNIVGIDEEQQLVAVGEMIVEGSQLMFCRRDGTSARQDMERMLQDIAHRANGNARGALYYSCLGRGRHQFGENSEELKMVKDALGDIPLVGFFANGEIFHNRLYAYTGVLSVFC
ncbi:MAG: FIST C-terminal domain-containing protein [Proteobacteria bacterium]|nr:FIST C-terminal domain-containing protein [Pseudomonadota bacterium]